jgi:hypothetical protein
LAIAVLHRNAGRLQSLPSVTFHPQMAVVIIDRRKKKNKKKTGENK